MPTDDSTHRPHFFSDDVRPFRLTAKERAKADEGVTVVSRPQPDGRYLVCAVDINNGCPIGVGITTDKAEISRACQSIGRSLHKFWLPVRELTTGVQYTGAMADAARHRSGRKQFERKLREPSLTVEQVRKARGME